MDDLDTVFRELSDYVPVAPYKVFTSPGEVEWNDFPAVVKISSTAHKTDVEGVVLGIRDEEELREAVESLLNIHPKVIVQPQMEGVEVFLGGKDDPHFGPAVSLGLGGIFVEVYRDVSTRLAPLSAADVDDMVNELKGGAILRGYRKKVDYDALVKAVLGFSSFLWEKRPKVAEVNPLIVTERGAFAVDARVFY